MKEVDDVDDNLYEALILSVYLVAGLFVSMSVILVVVIVGRRFRWRPFRSTLETLSSTAPPPELMSKGRQSPSLQMCNDFDIESHGFGAGVFEDESDGVVLYIIEYDTKEE